MSGKNEVMDGRSAGISSQMKSSCWSITINNPSEAEYSQSLPAKWALTGQIEEGAEGTTHYQGMLTTPHIRFSAVKKVFPRAHIEVAKNRKALEKYVHKDDTRIQAVPDNRSTIPTLFDYQHTIAQRWNQEDFEERLRGFDEHRVEYDIDTQAVEYVDTLVAEDIRTGTRGIEYIAINPMWRASWKKFWRAIIAREQLLADTRQTDRQTDTASVYSSSTEISTD